MAKRLYTSKEQARIDLVKQNNEIQKQVARVKEFAERNRGVVTNSQIAALTTENIDAAFEALHLTKDSVILQSYIKDFSKPRYDNQPEIAKVYDKLYTGGFFDRLREIATKGTAKSNTGSDFISNIFDVNDFHQVNFSHTNLRRNTSVPTIYKAAQNLKSNLTNGGYFATFDTETLGGTNNFGYNELNGITEFSFSIRKGGVDAPVKTFDNLIGFSDTDYQYWKKRVEAIDVYNMTQQDSVILGRFSKYGNPNTKISVRNESGYSNGAKWGVDKFDDAEDLIPEQKKAYALRAVERFRNEIGVAQEAAARVDGKTLWHDQYKEMVSIMNGTHSLYANTSIVDFNGTNFDVPMLNRFADNNPALKGNHITIPDGRHFDIYSGVKSVTNAKGSTHYLRGNFDAIDKSLGKSQQEQIINFFLGKKAYDGMVAHVANTDETVMSKLLTQEIDGGGTFFDKLFKDLEDVNAKSIKGTYTGANEQLFLLNQSNMFDGYNRTGGMSFRYDPVSKTMKTFNGYEIGAPDKVTRSSNVTRTSFNETGAKKRGLYTRQIVEINNTEQFKKLLNPDGNAEKVMQEYATDKLYAVITTPFQDDEMVKKAFGHKENLEGYYVELFNSIEAVEGLMNNGTVIANKKSGADPNKLSSWIPDAEVLKRPELQLRQMVDGTLTEAAPTLNDIAEIGLYRQRNDAAANFIRDMSYGKYIRSKKGLEQYKEEIRKVRGKDKSAKIANLISNNQPLTLKLLDAMGFNDYTARDGAKNIISNQVTNLMNAEKHLESMMPLFDMINEQLNKIMPTPEGTVPNELKQRRSLAFRNALTASLEHIARTGDTVDKQKINNGIPTKFFAEDMNYIEFDRSWLLDEPVTNRQGKTVLSSGEDVIRINLNNGDSLLKQLYDNKFKDNKVTDIDGNTGYDLLNKFYKKLNATEEYAGALNFGKGEFEAFQNRNTPDILSNEITLKLQEFIKGKREAGDSLFGIINTSNFTQNVIDPNTAVVDYMASGDKKSLGTAIRNTIIDTPTTRSLTFDDAQLEPTVQELVDKFLMPIKKEDYLEEIKFLDDVDHKTLAYKFDMARADAVTKARDILKGAANTDLKVIMANDSKNSLFIAKGNDIQRQITLPAIKSVNGILHTEVDGNKYVMEAVFDSSRVIGKAFDPNDVGYITNYGKAARDAYSMQWAMQKAMQEKSDVTSQFVSGISNWKQAIRKSAPAIEFANAQLFQDQFEQDINSIVTMLPEAYSTIKDLHKKGIIKDDKVFTHLDKIFNVKKGALRKEKIEDLTSTQRNAFMQKVLFPFAQYMAENTNDPVTKHFLENMSSRVKDVHFTQGKVGTGQLTLGGLSAYENQAKPTVTQIANVMYYDKAKVAEDIRKEGLTNIRTAGIISNNKADALMMNYRDTTTNRIMTSTISTKYLNIDNDSYKNIVRTEAMQKENAFLRKAQAMGYSGIEAHEVAAKLKEKALQVNLYEQEMQIDSRMFDVMFDKQRIQSISSRKQLQIIHENELATIQAMSNKNKLKFSIVNGHVVYDPGRVVNTGDSLVKTMGYNGTTSPYIAKYQGVFRGGYFNSVGELVDEETLTKQIQGLTSNKEMTDKLDSLFQYKYFVDPADAHYGSKLFMGTSEKGVVNPLLSKMGQFDKRITAALKGTSLEGELGTIRSKSWLEQQVYEKIRALGITGSFGSSEELIGAIKDERHATSDIIYRGINALDKGAHAMANQNISGHGHPMLPLKSMIGTLTEKGLFKDESFKSEFLSIFEGMDGVRINPDGTLHVPDNVEKSSINVRKLEALLESRNIKTEQILLGNKAIGTVGWTELTQVHDYLGGTNQGINRGRERGERMKAIEERINSLDRQIEAGSDNPEYIQRLKDYKTMAQKELIDIRDQETAEGFIHRGLKYSDRTHLTLNRTKLNDSFLENLKAGMSEDEYNDLVKNYVDGNGKLKEGLRGDAVLKSYTDINKRALLEGQGERRLSDMTQKERIANSHLISVFEDNPNYTIEKAKLMYSTGVNAQALAFNEKASSYDDLVKNGKNPFREVSIKELDLDVGGQAGTIKNSLKNPYSNELMIDIGTEFGENRYLAVGRGLGKVNGDGVIKEKPHQMLSTLKSQVETLGTLKTKEERDEQIQKILGTRAEIIQEQKKLNGKNGYAGDLIELRLNQSHLGKGATLAVNISDQAQYKALSTVNEKLSMLKNSNGALLERATIDGKSYLQHYAEGKVYDAQFRSMQAFRDMGYYDSDVLERRLKNIDAAKFGLDDFKYDARNVKANEEAMTSILERYGDVVLTDRFPEIQEGSVKPSYMFLDRNLADNEARAIGASGASMKLDNDGDTFFAATMRTSQGNSFLDKTLGAASIANDTELSDMVASQRLYMGSRSVGQNRYFEAKVQKALVKDMSRAIENGQLSEVALGSMINGRLYPNIASFGDMTEKVINERIDRVSPIIEQAKSMFQNLDLNNKEQSQNFNDAVVGLINKQHGEGTDIANGLIEDFVVERKYAALKLERTAKILKTTIGEANVTSFKVRKLYDAVMDPKMGDYNLRANMLQSVLYEAEESVISAKKIDKEVAEDRAAKWNQAINGILRGENVTQNLSAADEWMKENLADKLEEEAELVSSIDVDFRKKYGTDYRRGGSAIREGVISDLRALSTSEEVKLIRQSGRQNFGENLDGLSGKQMMALLSVKTDNSLQEHTIRALQKSGLISSGGSVTGHKLQGERVLTQGLEIIDGAARESTAGQEIKSILKSTGEVFSKAAKSFDGKTLAIGALGLAGAYLVAGFVGGNPSAPAQNQAEQQAEQDFYEVPPLQDTSNMNGIGQQSGYIININARTGKGKQHTMDALNRAVRGNVSTDVNIAMNINENTGNINDRYVEQLLAGAIQ